MTMQLACNSHAQRNATRIQSALRNACTVQCKSDALSREPCARDSREEVEVENYVVVLRGKHRERAPLKASAR